MAAYASWPGLLPEDIEVCTVQLPGRDDRIGEPPFTEMARLVEILAPALAPWLDLPFACFGHSMGALIAYELLRYFQRQGGPQALHLFVSSRRGPHLAASDPPCHTLPDAVFLAEIARRYNGLPQALLTRPALREIYLPLLRADFRLVETYQHLAGEPLPQSITAFGGSEDLRVTRSDLHAWKEMTSGRFQVHVLAGGHFFLQSAKSDLLRIIAGQLES